MTEETAIRIAEAVERIARSAEAISISETLIIFLVAGIYVAIIFRCLTDERRRK